MYQLLDNKLFFQSFRCVKYLNVNLPRMPRCGLTGRSVIGKQMARLLYFHLICFDHHWRFSQFFLNLRLQMLIDVLIPQGD